MNFDWGEATGGVNPASCFTLVICSTNGVLCISWCWSIRKPLSSCEPKAHNESCKYFPGVVFLPTGLCYLFQCFSQVESGCWDFLLVAFRHFSKLTNEVFYVTYSMEGGGLQPILTKTSFHCLISRSICCLLFISSSLLSSLPAMAWLNDKGARHH